MLLVLISLSFIAGNDEFCYKTLSLFLFAVNSCWGLSISKDILCQKKFQSKECILYAYETLCHYCKNTWLCLWANWTILYLDLILSCMGLHKNLHTDFQLKLHYKRSAKSVNCIARCRGFILQLILLVHFTLCHINH